MVRMVTEIALERYSKDLSKVDYEAMKKELMRRIRPSSTIEDVQKMAKEQFRLWCSARM